MESLLKAKPIFSWFAKATNGSSWQALEKKVLMKKLAAKSTKKLLKKLLCLTDALGKIVEIFSGGFFEDFEVKFGNYGEQMVENIGNDAFVGN